ncbi:MAG: hypothetical protein ACRCZK_00030 [Oscillospiraceae bacterium]
MTIILFFLLMDITGVKDKVQFCLTEKYLDSFLIYYFIATLIYFSISKIVLSPIMMGIKKIFFNNLKDNQQSYDVFMYYSSIKDIIKIYKLAFYKIFIKVYNFAFYFTIPIIVLLGSFNYFLYANNNLTSAFMSFVTIISLCILGLSVFKYLKFLSGMFMMDYIYIYDDSIDIKGYYEKSKDMVNEKDVLIFYCSFICWFLASVFILPFFYFFGYFHYTFSIYARYLLYKQHDKYGPMNQMKSENILIEKY